MELNTVSITNPALTVTEGYPAGYRGPFIHGSIVKCGNNTCGNIVTQELSADIASFSFIVGKVVEKLSASFRLNKAGLYIFWMLKNSMRKKIEGVGKVHLRENYFTAFITQKTTCSIIIESKSDFRVFEMHIPSESIKKLIPLFPQLGLLHNTEEGIFLFDKSRWTAPSISEVINELINCEHSEATRQFYYDLKIKELLYLFLESSSQNSLSKIRLTAFEISRIHQAKAVLENYINKKPPTLREISKQVAINQYKLKNGFRYYFQSGIIQWLINRKMNYAKELILTTNKPIKEIAHLVGYPRTTNFITAFRRYFGITPGSLRR